MGLLMMQLLNCTQNLPETSGNSLVLAALRRAAQHAAAIAHGQAGTLDIGGARNGHRLS